MSRNRTISRSVGQALVPSKYTRGDRKQDSSKGGKGVFGGTAAAKNDRNNSTKNVGKKSTTLRASVTVAWSKDIDGSTAPHSSFAPRISH